MKYQLVSEEEARNLPRTFDSPNDPDIAKILGPAKGYPKAFIKITDNEGNEKVAAFKLVSDDKGWAPGFPAIIWVSARPYPNN